MSLTKLSLGENTDVIYKLFPPMESLVSDIPAGDDRKLFLQCYVLLLEEQYLNASRHPLEYLPDQLPPQHREPQKQPASLLYYIFC
jgi:hypothetical protein